MKHLKFYSFFLCATCSFMLTAQTQITTDNNKTTISSSEADVIIEEATPEKFPPNEFTGSFTMTTSSTNKKGQVQPPMSINIYSDIHSVCYEMKPDPKKDDLMRYIIDPTTATMTMLTDSKSGKTGMIMKMPKFTIRMKGGKTVPPEEENVKIEATNDYKTIEGFECRKYIITSSKATTESWITKDNSVSLHNLFGMFSVTQKGANENDFMSGYGGMRGMMLESTSTLNDGGSSTIKITNIKKGNVDKNKFSTEGYTLMDMSQGFKGLFGQ